MKTTKQINSIKSFRINSGTSRTNSLQAAVLGANDGIISIAALLIGVAGAEQPASVLLATGVAGIVAGAISLAVGEYVSVSSRRDFEEAILAKEKVDLITHPSEELEDLVEVYESEGLSHREAQKVAEELTKANAFLVHADVDYNIDPHHLTKPLSSALFSAGSFILGAALPLFAIILPAGGRSIEGGFLAVILALTATGIFSAKVSGSPIIKPTLRIVIGGALAMIITYLIGSAFRI